MAEESPKDKASKSLSRVQKFEAASLTQRDRLGNVFEFSDAVNPAERLISLFQKLPLGSLDFFPDNELSTIQSLSDSVFRSFQEILDFDPQVTDATSRRQTITSNLEGQYQSAFSKLHPFISFSIARTANFTELDEQGRAAIQSIEDRISDLVGAIEEKDLQAQSVLDDIRKASAEQGVSQEAIHFANEAEKHEALSETWRKYTVRTALGLGVYSVGTIFLHRIPWIAPTNQIETIQFIVSKILIFAVLAYMLALCARNFLSHKHNSIVNRHRQNALMTYRSLVNAGGSQESRDIVLQQAASAIYQLHDTGYVKGGDGASKTSLIEVLPRATVSPQLSGSTGT